MHCVCFPQEGFDRSACAFHATSCLPEPTVPTPPTSTQLVVNRSTPIRFYGGSYGQVPRNSGVRWLVWLFPAIIVQTSVERTNRSICSSRRRHTRCSRVPAPGHRWAI